MLPFNFGKIITDDFFVNREQELQQIKNYIPSGINLTLIAPRRYGKSSLIHKLARLFETDEKVKFCKLDLFNVRNEQEFYEYYATEVIKASSSIWEEKLENIKSFFNELMPKISFSISTHEEISLSFDKEELKKQPNEILHLAEKISKEKNIKIVVCIDEFQNIAFFEDSSAFQKKLRSIWQTHQSSNYILYGSKQNMMIELFEKKSQPFYKFGEVMCLGRIKNEHWVSYITKKFEQTGKFINKENASILAHKAENHPYFVQQLANYTWMETSKEATVSQIEKAIENILTQYDLFFMKEMDSLSNLQIKLLKAIIHNEKQLSGKNTIQKYNLNSSASVIQAKKALIQKDIIDENVTKNEFLDPMFKIWLKQIYFDKKND
jgi:hypothetical protein